VELDSFQQQALTNVRDVQKKHQTKRQKVMTLVVVDIHTIRINFYNLILENLIIDIRRIFRKLIKNNFILK